jgi:hypothetical protein
MNTICTSAFTTPISSTQLFFLESCTPKEGIELFQRILALLSKILPSINSTLVELKKHNPDSGNDPSYFLNTYHPIITTALCYAYYENLLGPLADLLELLSAAKFDLNTPIPLSMPDVEHTGPSWLKALLPYQETYRSLHENLQNDLLDIYFPFSTGSTPPTHLQITFLWLICCSENDNIGLVEILLKIPSIDTNSSPIGGVTPLYLACQYEQVQLAKILLSHPKTQQKQTTAQRNTLLALCCTPKLYCIAELLIQLGIESSNDWHGQVTDVHCPFYEADQLHYLPLARLLINRTDPIATVNRSSKLIEEDLLCLSLEKASKKLFQTIRLNPYWLASGSAPLPQYRAIEPQYHKLVSQAFFDTLSRPEKARRKREFFDFFRTLTHLASHQMFKIESALDSSLLRHRETLEKEFWPKALYTATIFGKFSQSEQQLLRKNWKQDISDTAFACPTGLLHLMDFLCSWVYLKATPKFHSLFYKPPIPSIIDNSSFITSFINQAFTQAVDKISQEVLSKIISSFHAQDICSMDIHLGDALSHLQRLWSSHSFSSEAPPADKFYHDAAENIVEELNSTENHDKILTLMWSIICSDKLMLDRISDLPEVTSYRLSLGTSNLECKNHFEQLISNYWNPSDTLLEGLCIHDNLASICYIAKYHFPVSLSPFQFAFHS